MSFLKFINPVITECLVFGSISKQLTWNDKRFDIDASGQTRRPTINQWCEEEWANNKHNQVDLSSWPVLDIINFSIKVFGSCSKPSNMLEVGKWFQHMRNLEVRIYYWLNLNCWYSSSPDDNGVHSVRLACSRLLLLFVFSSALSPWHEIRSLSCWSFKESNFLHSIWIV